MKTTKGTEKIKISYTLSEFESELFRQAVQIAFPQIPHMDTFKRDRQRLVGLALGAFCAAVIRQGWKDRNGYPSVLIRSETNDECESRIAGKMPSTINDQIMELTAAVTELKRDGLRFSPAASRALNWFQKKYHPKTDTRPGEVAGWILQHALANPKALCAMIDAFNSYRDLEGFAERGNELAEARIAARPEYKRPRQRR